MNLLSIDVGIKNLALCLIHINEENKISIKKWNVLNLCNEKKISCKCGKNAKYCYKDYYCCKKHISETGHSLIADELQINKLKKQKVDTIKTILKSHSIEFSEKISKVLLIEFLEKYYKDNFVLHFDNTVKANDFTLVEIGINMKSLMDELYENDIINTVIIENQISPIANRMKTLQGMIAQYFIMKDVHDIHFISSANKLKDFETKKQTTYNERKKKGIEVCEELLINNNLNEHLDIFLNSKKKDDLADCFLQAIWYLKEKLKIIYY